MVLSPLMVYFPPIPWDLPSFDLEGTQYWYLVSFGLPRESLTTCQLGRDRKLTVPWVLSSRVLSVRLHIFRT